ncbi:MAG: DNA adenine methylase [Treponema sp.]|jgi:DNA adenine methylase|nr:DNA adenine methylase [Treponema sp.]
MAEKNPLLKPYLKWAGGKRQLLPEIRKHLPPDMRGITYYEPFAGAGAVLFDLQPKKAVINDCNAELMMTYRVIREQIGELIQALRVHQAKNTKTYYYEIRNIDRDPAAYRRLTDAEKAARLVFLNKTCYNGLYRVNSRGRFNVPHGRYKNPVICDEPLLRAAHAYLAAGGIDIRCGDFEAAMQDAAAESFVYFDPPYHSPAGANFTAYQPDGFGEAEQIRLRDLFLALTSRGVRCLLSNADTPFIRRLYADRRLEIIQVPARRFINSKTGGRGAVNETLIKNWK